MRTVISRPPAPPRVRLTTAPVMLTTGRSSVGGVGAGGVGSGGGVVVVGGSVTVGPGCVEEVGVSGSSLQAASGTTDESARISTAFFNVVASIELAPFGAEFVQARRHRDRDSVMNRRARTSPRQARARRSAI